MRNLRQYPIVPYEALCAFIEAREVFTADQLQSADVGGTTAFSLLLLEKFLADREVQELLGRWLVAEQSSS